MSTKKFKILDGTFRDSDDTVKGPGDTIELGADVASQHAHRLQELPAEDAPAAHQGGDQLAA